MLLISTLCFSKEDINKHQINLFTKQLCSDIRYIRKTNMLGDSNTYIYYKKNKEAASYVVRSGGEDIKEIKLSNNIKLEYMREKILFKRDGSPDPKGQTISVYDNKTKKEITIVPVSGRVLLKEGKYET
jgi:hypothetical protein